jgi:peptide chain release factor 2
VRAYQADAQHGQPGLQLAVRVEGSTAVVTGTPRVRPPFAVLGQGDVTVTAVTRARVPSSRRREAGGVGPSRRAAWRVARGVGRSAPRPPRAGRAPVASSLVPDDRSDDLAALDATLTSIEKVLDLPRLRVELGDLEAQAGEPGLWDDTTKAQRVTTRLSNVKTDIERVEGLRRRLDDVAVLFQMAAEEGDEGVAQEASSEVDVLQREISSLEVRTLLSGEYDQREALVQITPGAGGVDSQDWALMLWRMYYRWAERHGYPLDVHEWQEAEEAGVKSVIFQVKAPYAYGTLAGEHGVHRLVRISPFDNQARRQTSFAMVDVTPVVDTADAVEVDEKDLRIDVFRSSGPGGQGVNTTDSAVRITHLPTGVVVSCQNERSQIQNRATALIVLQTKLLEKKREQEAAEMDAIRGGKGEIAFGSQIRNYVLHPYQMVKDLRTGVETGATGAVLDGDIDDLVEAAIRWRRTSEVELEA